MENFFGQKEGNIYLDNGASTLALNKVKNAVDEFLLNYGSVHRGSGFNSEISTSSYENARKNILEIIDGNEEEHAVIFTANTTDGINKFALMSDFKNVLVSDIEHSSNKLPWYKNANVYELKTIDFKINLEELDKTLNENRNIDLVALSGASNITGYVTDVEGVYKICKKYNVTFLLDASQYAPHFKPSLKYCDVIVYCGHKMYAPFGAGVLAGKKDLFRKENKALTGGGNVVYATKEKTIYKDAPYMHESGTPNGIGAIAISKSHDVLYKEIGESNLKQHNNELVNAISNIVDDLEKVGYKVYFGRKDSNISQTPILVLSNTKKSNIETVKLLNSKIGKYDKNIFCREGAFCAYSLIEKLKKIENVELIKDNMKIDLKELDKISEKSYIADERVELGSSYSLIRFSAGLINEAQDIEYLKEKLIEINKGEK